MLTARTSVPLSELVSVRRALSFLPFGRCGRCACTAEPALRRMELLTRASRPSDASSRRPADGATGKGFGAPQRPTIAKQPQPRREPTFEADPEAEDEEEEGPEFAGRPEYQIYTDEHFMPKRFIGSVQATTHEAMGRTLVATSELNIGDLVMLLPALAWLEGELFEAPEPEDLHVSMLEDGLTAAQRHVLDLMDREAAAHQRATLTTLDAKFWGSRGSSDASGAPAIDSARLLRIINSCCCLESQQDATVMQIRQQAPNGFIGLWPELSLMAHSCVPNTSLTFIGDRLLVHAVEEIKAGQPPTRNCIGPVVTQPLAARRAAVMEARGYKCNCPRCVTEESVSEGVQQVLEEAAAWFSEEAQPQWNAAQQTEDMEALKVLCDEAEQIVTEVEEALEAEAAGGLSESQAMLLRCSAYDCYDLLVMCDEFINQDSSHLEYLHLCLEVISSFAPGSESHTLVALKYDALVRTRAELAEYVAAKELERGGGGGGGDGQSKRGGRLGLSRRRGGISRAAAQAARAAKELRGAAEDANNRLLQALYTRYGLVSVKQLGMLKEGMDMYIDALEQMSVMQAAGQTEMSTDYMIDGVKFTLTDKLGGLSGSGSNAGGGEAGPGFESGHQSGVQVMYMEDGGGLGGEEEEEEEEEGGERESWREGEVVDVEAQTVSRSLAEVEVGGVQGLGEGQAPVGGKGGERGTSRRQGGQGQGRGGRRQR